VVATIPAGYARDAAPGRGVAVGLCAVSALSAHPMLFVAIRSLFYTIALR
jgi:hypothetical protein